GLLELFLTDFYWSGLVAGVGEYVLPKQVRIRARQRRSALISRDKIRVLWLSTIRREMERRTGRSPSIVYSQEGIRFSKAAAHEALRRRGDLFLYPPCAYEA